MIFFRGSTGGAVKIVKNTTYCSASDPMSDLSSNVSCFLDFIPVAMLPGPPCRWGRHPNAVVMRTRRVLAVAGPPDLCFTQRLAFGDLPA